jgi:hypothetical protein
LTTLARLIANYAPHDGSFELRLPGVHANRFSRANKECVHTLRLPSLCIAAQGAKTVIVGDEVCVYNASRMIVFSVAAQVTQASHSAPYLSLKLDLDPHKIAELVLKGVSARSASSPGATRHLPDSGRCRHRRRHD